MVVQLLRTLECLQVYLCIRSIISNPCSCIGETSHIWPAFLPGRHVTAMGRTPYSRRSDSLVLPEKPDQAPLASQSGDSSGIGRTSHRDAASRRKAR